MDKDRVYTVKELSEMLKLREPQVRNLLNRGVIKGFKIGRYWRVAKEEIDRLMSGVQNWTDWHEKEEL